MNKKAFLTVEILISMIIVFLAIVTLSAAIKSNTMISQKKDIYEDIYITVQSIKNDLLSMDIQYFENDTPSIEDFFNTDPNTASKRYNTINLPYKQLNRFTINLKAKKVKEIKNFIETLEGGSNKGLDTSVVFHVILTLKRENFEKEYSFYLNKFIKSDHNAIFDL
jgi:hypothetical protein